MSSANHTPAPSGTTKKKLTTSAMIASIASEGQATRPAPFGHALAALAEQRQDIVGLSADLSKYTDLHIFAKAHPERFYQMGMAEQLLMSAAAGMARRVLYRLRPLMRYSPPDARMTSFVWRLPKTTSMSKSSAACRA